MYPPYQLVDIRGRGPCLPNREMVASAPCTTSIFMMKDEEQDSGGGAAEETPEDLAREGLAKRIADQGQGGDAGSIWH